MKQQDFLDVKQIHDLIRGCLITSSVYPNHLIGSENGNSSSESKNGNDANKS